MASCSGFLWVVPRRFIVGWFIAIWGGNPIKQTVAFSMYFVFLPSAWLVLGLICHDVLEKGHPALAVAVVVQGFAGMLYHEDKIPSGAPLELFHAPKGFLRIFFMFPSNRRALRSGLSFMRDFKSHAAGLQDFDLNTGIREETHPADQDIFKDLLAPTPLCLKCGCKWDERSMGLDQSMLYASSVLLVCDARSDSSAPTESGDCLSMGYANL
jgi:hypothetical protein